MAEVRSCYTVKQAAEATGRSENAIRLMIHKKKITPLKGKFDNRTYIHVSVVNAIMGLCDPVKASSLAP